MSDPSTGARRRDCLVTGFPNFLLYRVIQQFLRTDPAASVSLVVLEHLLAKARRIVQGLGRDARRVAIVSGDTASLDLGLSGAEYKDLTSRITHIHHGAAIYQLGVSSKRTFETNVDGTRNLLRFAADCPRIERVFHYSSIFVSGLRTGTIREDELAHRAGFKNDNERSRHKAEQLAAAAMTRLPVTVFRLGIIVGDSKSGEIHRFEGPYLLLRYLLSRDGRVPLVMPGSCRAPAHLAPVDFVADAIAAIGRNPASIGRTFHLIDPYPLPARDLIDKVCRYLGRNPPIYGIPPALYKGLFLIPGMERYAGVPKQIFDYFNHPAVYDSAETVAFLNGTGITCPPFESYFTFGIEYAGRLLKQKIERREAAATPDPFDPAAG